jgi:hypothetical protein
VPQPKIGVAASAMKRRGVLDDPERFQAVRLVKMLNAVRPMMKAIKERGEIYQVGAGKAWWQKSISFMARIREQADKVVKKTWWNRLDTRHHIKSKDGPQMGM